MTSSDDPFFEIRSSPIAGKGAFALRRIPKGKRLIEYTGERVSHEVADARYDEEERKGNYHTVLFSVDDKTVIDANVDGNDARFFNHSCDPNCTSVIVKKRVWLETLREIQPGEELVYDYEIPNEGETEEEALRKYPCHCGAENCRRTLLLAPEKPKKRRKSKPKSKSKPRTKASKTKSRTTASSTRRRKTAATRRTRSRATARR